MNIEPRLGACAVIYDVENNEVLMGRRSDLKQWSFAGGKTELVDNDILLNTAVRELKEEFGVTLDFDNRLFSWHNLGPATVSAYRRVKHNNSPDTFELTLYQTNVFLFIVDNKSIIDKYTDSSCTDNEMLETKWVSLKNIFKDIDDMFPATMVVANMVRLYLR